VFEAADAGNFDCITMLKRATDYLASAIADAVALLDLDLVVIGGGVGMSPSFVRRLSSSLARMPAGFVRPVVTARLGSDAGLIGAALLAREPALP
jgi:predicted NBD/HSP70 family sugar kinase